MPSPTGRWRSLPLPRRWIADLMAAARSIPYVGIDRRMDLVELIAAREKLTEPPAWAAIFLKAYALVAARNPPLRWTYLPFPWPHLYETDESVAVVAVAREYDGVPAVFFGQVRSPDRLSLRDVTALLRDLKTKPVEEVKAFSRLIRLTRLPLPLRRVLWWMGLNVSGRHRVRMFGSFGLTTLGSAGVDVRRIVSALPVCLTYGPFAPDGSAVVGLEFDHRVMDGTTSAALLLELEQTLRGEVLTELRAASV